MRHAAAHCGHEPRFAVSDRPRKVERPPSRSVIRAGLRDNQRPGRLVPDLFLVVRSFFSEIQPQQHIARPAAAPHSPRYRAHRRRMPRCSATVNLVGLCAFSTDRSTRHFGHPIVQETCGRSHSPPPSSGCQNVPCPHCHQQRPRAPTVASSIARNRAARCRHSRRSRSSRARPHTVARKNPSFRQSDQRQKSRGGSPLPRRSARTPLPAWHSAPRPNERSHSVQCLDAALPAQGLSRSSPTARRAHARQPPR